MRCGKAHWIVWTAELHSPWYRVRDIRCSLFIMGIASKDSAERGRLGCGLAWAFLAGLAVGGCGANAPDRDASALGLVVASPVIHLMPILDRRTIERSQYILAAQQVESATVSILGEKGYRVEIAELSPGERVQISIDSGAAELSAEELVRAGPPSAERLLVVYLDLIDTEFNAPTLDFRVKVSAVLIDTVARVAVWQSSAEGNSNLAGAFSVRSPSAAQYEAIYRSLTNLFVSLG